MSIADDVKRTIAEVGGMTADAVADGARLDELITDSFTLVELVIELQEQHAVRLTQEDLRPVRTVRDLVRLIQTRLET